MKTGLLKLLVALMTVASLIPATVGFANAARDVRFTGTIQSLPSGTLIGNWTVSGRTVVVSTSTIVDQSNGPAVVGATVLVEGLLQSNGSINAQSIDVKGTRAMQPSGQGAPSIASAPRNLATVGLPKYSGDDSKDKDRGGKGHDR